MAGKRNKVEVEFGFGDMLASDEGAREHQNEHRDLEHRAPVYYQDVADTQRNGDEVAANTYMDLASVKLDKSDLEQGMLLEFLANAEQTNDNSSDGGSYRLVHDPSGSPTELAKQTVSDLNTGDEFQLQMKLLLGTTKSGNVTHVMGVGASHLQSASQHVASLDLDLSVSHTFALQVEFDNNHADNQANNRGLVATAGGTNK